MARPQRTRTSRRVQVEQPTAAPGLDVVAPLDVRVPGSSAADNWAALSRALAVGGQVVAQNKQARDAHDINQGAADERLGKADGERIAASQKYADGVYNVRTLKRWQDAAADVAQRASQELDQSLPVDRKIAQIDRWFLEEMGDLINDPKARLLVAPRYEEFLNRYANAEVQAQVGENEQLAVDTVGTDIAESLESGKFGSYEESHQRLSRVMGGTKATAQLVGIILDRAEAVAATGGDAESVYGLIPTAITTADGQSLPGPRNTPRYNDLIKASQARAAKARAEYLGPERAFREFQVRNNFEKRILNADVVTPAELADYVKDGTLTPEQASSINIRSLEAQRKHAEETNEWLLNKSVLASVGGESWLDAVGLENGPKNQADAQKFTDRSISEYIKGASQSEGTQPVLDGPTMLSQGVDSLSFQVAVQASKDMRLPYTPLKSFLSQVTAAQPEGILARLPMYEVLKSQNIAGMYLDDDSAALYESVLTMSRAGEKPEQIAQSVKGLNDPQRLAYVRQERSAVQKKLLNGEFDVLNSFWDTSAKNIANQPYLRTRVAALAELGLNRGLPAGEAIEYAKKRFNDTHFAVKVGGRTLVIPELPQHRSAELAGALEWLDGAAKVFAQEQGVPDADTATISLDLGINGRAPEVFFMTAAGERLNTTPFSFDAMLQQYRKGKSPEARKKAEAIFDRQTRVRRELDKPNPLLFDTR